MNYSASKKSRLRAAAVLAIGSILALSACTPPPEPGDPVDCQAAPQPGINLSGCVLTGDFTGVDLSGANLSHTQIHDATLLEANLSGANLSGAWLRDINTSPEAEAICDLELGGSLHYTTCRTGMNFSGANLKGARIESSNFRQANLSSVLASRAIFDAVLDDVNFSNAVLNDSTFSGSQYNTVWTGASARRSTGIFITVWSIPSDLTDANLTVGSYAEWGNINLSGATVKFVPTAEQTLWFSYGGLSGVPKELPPGYKIIRGYIVGPGTSLYEVDLSGADLRGVDLTQVYMLRANLRGVNLSGTTITAAMGSAFFGAGPFFEGSDLTGANLQGAQISYASFKSANLTNANLSGTHSYLTDFRGAVLSGADLSNAAFDGVDFTGATGMPTGGASSTNGDDVICPDGVTVPPPGTCWAT